MVGKNNIMGSSLDVDAEIQADDGDNNAGFDGHLGSPSAELKQSWLLRPEKEKRKKKFKIYIKDMMVRRTLVTVGILAVLITVVVKIVLHYLRRNHHVALPDNYTVALHQALLFFNAQRSGILPKTNNVSWRGDSCLQDGKPFINDLVGGYYDGGDATKFNFPASFSITMLSWSVIEYSAKYKAAGELNHVEDIIKWGTDYLLKTFNSSAHSIYKIAAQVGAGDGGRNNDRYCWMRPEDIDYTRPVSDCHSCPALAAEMAAALAAASIVFKNSKDYSKKLVHSAEMLFKFATSSGNPDPFTPFYNSTSHWDELVWGAAWLYCATGNSTYLQLATDPEVAKRADAFWGGPNRAVLSWDNKHAGAQLLLSRLRMFLGHGFPYEEMLSTFHDQTTENMCMYLPAFPTFNRTGGGLIQLNHGKARPLQDVVHAAFLATLYSDYLAASLTPGWFCGPNFYSKDALRDFAKTQIDYILGKNPQRMSYIVGFGDPFPRHVHHRGASIPRNKIKYGCKEGWKWRDSPEPNPNIIVGAMVGGPDKHDGFHDVRSNYNYTEPNLAGNAGLVAALVALSGGDISGIDMNTIFYAVPPLHPYSPPPPSPWIP